MISQTVAVCLILCALSDKCFAAGSVLRETAVTSQIVEKTSDANVAATNARSDIQVTPSTGADSLANAVPQPTRDSVAHILPLPLPEPVQAHGVYPDRNAPVGGRVKSNGKVIAGSCLFGVSYGLSLVVSTMIMTEGGDDIGMAFLVPVVGPIIALLTDPPPSDIFLPIALLCTGWSAAQTIGLTLLISGAAGKPAQLVTSSNFHLHIEPTIIQNSPGAVLRLSFAGL